MTDRPKRPRDANQLAKHIVDLATGEAEEEVVNPKMDHSNRSRKGGLAGGAARARSLTEAERRRIAKEAASARWKRDRPVQETKE